MLDRVSPWIGLVSLGFAVAGLTKVTDMGIQRRMFRRWGWTDDNRRLVGSAEIVGAALVCARPTRRLGGAILATSSAVVLASELSHGEGPVGLPRLAMLLAAITAL